MTRDADKKREQFLNYYWTLSDLLTSPAYTGEVVLYHFLPPDISWPNLSNHNSSLNLSRNASSPQVLILKNTA